MFNVTGHSRHSNEHSLETFTPGNEGEQYSLFLFSLASMNIFPFCSGLGWVVGSSFIDAILQLGPGM